MQRKILSRTRILSAKTFSRYFFVPKKLELTVFDKNGTQNTQRVFINISLSLLLHMFLYFAPPFWYRK